MCLYNVQQLLPSYIDIVLMLVALAREQLRKLQHAFQNLGVVLSTIIYPLTEIYLEIA